MIEQLFQLALVNALIIYGLYNAAKFEWKNDSPYNINYKTVKESDVDEDSKMIFWRARFYANKWFGEYWAKPIITCPICMASVHSTYIYFFQHPFNIWSTPVEQLYMYALHILLTAGIGAFIVQFEK